MAPPNSNESRPSGDDGDSGFNPFAKLIAGLSALGLAEPKDANPENGERLPNASVVALAPALIEALPGILQLFEYHVSSGILAAGEETEQIRASLVRSVGQVDQVRRAFDRQYPGVRDDPEKMAESKRALDCLMSLFVKDKKN